MKHSHEKSVLFDQNGQIVTLTLNRIAENNSLNDELLSELHHQISTIEANNCCHIVVIRGKNGIFSSGMDFTYIEEKKHNNYISHTKKNDELGYAQLLRRMSESPIIFISAVDGDVVAGGLGIVAASDLVFATPSSQFRLTEAMWSLLPANVTPYLIRRTGFQPAFRMTLTTEKISASEAQKFNLVDYITEDLDFAIKKKYLMLHRIDSQTVQEIKNFFRSQWFASGFMETEANKKMHSYRSNKKVHDNIKRYVTEGIFPWEQN